MQWIRERATEPDGSQYSEDFKTSEDFLRFLTQLDQYAPQLLSSIAKEITAPSEPPSIDLLKERLHERTKLSFDPDMLLTAACAYALEKSPQLETWQRIRKVAYNSWQIEYWLGTSMAAAVKRDAGTRGAYIKLAKLLFEKLESGCLKSESQRWNEARENSWTNWQNAQYQLDELLDGLRHSDFMAFEDEMPVFKLLSEIAPEVMQQLIAGSSNPFLVKAALLSAGVGAFNPRFAQWEAFVSKAPSTFSQDGGWTGSLLLPLLLAHARQELLEPGRHIPRYDADETNVAAITDQVSEMVDVVVKTLASREDAPGAFIRWSTWLIRQMLRQKESEFSDIRSGTFVDDALLKAIGKTIQGGPHILTPPEDAAPWEAWCYRCVRSLFAHEGLIEPPPFEDFASEWRLSLESWHDYQGRSLLERADLHLPRDDTPGLSANLLAFPLASRKGFALAWKQLWDSTYPLREVIEFGSPDARTNTYSDRADASHLLLLLGFIGLACFDQTATRFTEGEEGLAEEMACLHEALAAAAQEVLYMDDTLNHNKWKVMLQHLALRRVYWDSAYTPGHRAPIFAKQHAPTIQAYLQHFRADPSDLVALLHACMLNELDTSLLRQDLRGASVDLRTCVDTLKQLNTLRDNRYPMRGDAIRAIEPLFE
ncbi:hypothetical protein ACM79J_26385 [Pseudomonas aeruginosa]|nr:hypothetical protein [Pseudomonas aeruginosa]